MSAQKVLAVMTQPISLIFKFLRSKSRVQLLLMDNNAMRLEGRLMGFDEYMNVVLDDAEEVCPKSKSRKILGRIMLKGENICLMYALKSN